MTQAQLGEAIGTTGQYVNTPVVLLTNEDYEQEA